MQLFSKISYIMDFNFRGNDHGTCSSSSYFEALKLILKIVGSIPSEQVKADLKLGS